jgi:outer membrane receptor protein involved in Fe transport
MSSGVGQDFFLYPDLYLKYDLVEKIIIPYAGINGGVKRNNYRNLTRVNPFIETDPITSLENTKYNVFAGVRGELASYLSFNAGFSYKQVDNLALFVNEIDSLGGVALYNRFNVRYDDVQIGTLSAELGYQKMKRFSFLLKGEYFFYNLKNEQEAWQMPNLKISFNGTYNISDKIRLTADVFYIGERYARSLVAAGNKNYGNGEYGIKLDPLFDLNLGAEYFINPRWTAFARFYNLTNSRYAIYNEYYQQGITFMVGTTYKFWGSKKRVK